MELLVDDCQFSQLEPERIKQNYIHVLCLSPQFLETLIYFYNIAFRLLWSFLHFICRPSNCYTFKFLIWILLISRVQVQESDNELINNVIELVFFVFKELFCYDKRNTECGPRSSAWSGTCQSGRSQSPINIPLPELYWKFRTDSSHTISFNDDYRNGLAKYYITNNGRTVIISASRDLTSRMVMQPTCLDASFVFSQVHCHWTSEHTYSSIWYPLECHFVHYRSDFVSIGEALDSNEDGTLTVIAIIYKLGFENGPMKVFTDNLKQVKMASRRRFQIDDGVQLNILKMLAPTTNLWNLFRNPSSQGTLDTFKYLGSLTTPTCKESINWLVLRHPQTISMHQYRQFLQLRDEEQKSVTGNFRDRQSLNGRTITPTRLRIV